MESNFDSIEIIPAKVKCCKSCHQIKPIEQFAHNNLAKDGYQLRCLPCAAARPTGQKLKRAIKMAKFLTILPKKNGIMKEAYKEISKVTTENSASATCSEFLSNPNNSFNLAEALLEPEIQGLCHKYFNDALKEGALNDKRDAIALLSKLTGQSLERSESRIRLEAIAPEAREAKVSQIIELTRKKAINE